MTDPITEALDAFVPVFDSAEGDWQAILQAASRPASVAAADRHMPRRGILRRTTSVRRTVALAVVLVALLGLGVAWAAGAWTSKSPQVLFESSFPSDSGSGSIFAGHVIPDSVKPLGSIDIPNVGPVVLWHGVTKAGGWCLGLRLSNKDWLGTGESPLDGGGSVPGCFPVGVIDRGNKHLEWLENDIDASSVGGTTWRIRSGVITVPGAVKVTDLTTGQSTPVVDGDVFMLAIQAPIPSVAPYKSPVLHLVAYDQAGNLIASDRSGG